VGCEKSLFSITNHKKSSYSSKHTTSTIRDIAESCKVEVSKKGKRVDWKPTECRTAADAVEKQKRKVLPGIEPGLAEHPKLIRIRSDNRYLERN
jgi:hypothetical protein